MKQNNLPLLIGALGIAWIFANRNAQVAPSDSGEYDYAGPVPDDSSAPVAADMSAQNLDAFLALIRHAEARDDYGALVGGGSFSDFSDHPANLGWPGVHIGVGLSTAAGGYQITQTTFNGFRQPGWTRRMPVPAPNDVAPDFSPAVQDALAAKLIARRGALAAVQAGDFQTALVKLRGEWEAFDRMLDGRYPITIAQAQDYYVNQGGTLV